MTASFHARDLKKSYNGRQVVKNVSIDVERGEIVGLLGPNGAGKTTSLYMMVGLVKADEGKINLLDEDVTSQPLHVRARKGIGYLPQEASVFRELTVEENIVSVLEVRDLSEKERQNALDNLISDFGLDHIRKSKGRELSGGERRRVEIARSLALDPKFILLDEPFAGVDPIAVEEIQSIVARLKERNIGILITDHNVQETLSITDRAYLLAEGKIMLTGTPMEIANNEMAKKFYLGQNFELRKKKL